MAVVQRGVAIVSFFEEFFGGAAFYSFNYSTLLATSSSSH